MKYNKRGRDGKFKKSIIERPGTAWASNNGGFSCLTDIDNTFVNWMDEITQTVNELSEERQQKPCTCGHSKENGNKTNIGSTTHFTLINKELNWKEIAREIGKDFFGSNVIEVSAIEVFKKHGLIKE